MLKLLVLSVVLLYLVIVVYAYFAADRQIFFPPARTYSEDDLPVRMIRTTDGVDIATVHLPNPSAEFTILFSHGNAEDMGMLRDLFFQFVHRGFSVLAYDYRGYGLSQGGPPTADGAYLDIDAAYRHATEVLEIPASRLILYGRSVGSGPAVYLASTVPVAGLIIEGAFTSAFQVLTRVPLLPFDRFPNLKQMAQIRIPVLVIHGEDDAVISISHSRKLFKAAQEPKHSLWVQNAGHNDIMYAGGESYWQALINFCATLP